MLLILQSCNTGSIMYYSLTHHNRIFTSCALYIAIQLEQTRKADLKTWGCGTKTTN